MRNRIVPFLLLIFLSNNSNSFSQQIQVSTILKDINASGGLTMGQDGNLYVSDFGRSFPDTLLTSAYRVEWGTWKVTKFAEGFKGASGNCFDNRGNFYQSNPKGKRISKIKQDGTVIYDWVSEGLVTPIGIVADEEDNLFVCNCGSNTISKVTPDGSVSVFSESELFNCPNGITRDPLGNLYACNFNDGKVLKITGNGSASIFAQLPELPGPNSNLGNGHLTWKNNFLFVATIGTGEIFKINSEGKIEKITGLPLGFSNIDGGKDVATFSKPNGIISSKTGDTLILNVSEPTWKESPLQLHPAHLRMITGLRSLEDFNKEFDFHNLNDMAWILGKWNRTNLPQGKTGNESWIKISDRKYNGIGVRIENGKTTFKEDLTLELRDEGIFYGAYVEENKKWIYFKVVNKSENYFVVENKAHDYPKRIVYSLNEDNSLKVRISGDGNATDFQFSR